MKTSHFHIFAGSCSLYLERFISLMNLPPYFKPRKAPFSRKPSDYIFDANAKKRCEWIRSHSAKWSMEKYLKEIKALHQKFPSELIIESWYLAIWGDWSQTKSADIESRTKKKVSERYLALLKKTRNVPHYVRTHLQNEYFYHSFQPRKQYLQGIKELKRGFPGQFPVAVGASDYACEIAIKGQTKRAHRYAQISYLTWRTYPDPIHMGAQFYFQAIAFIEGGAAALKAFDDFIKTDPHSKKSHRYYYKSRRLKLVKVINTFK